jgi:very-short-patch-repair endonuclease
MPDPSGDPIRGQVRRRGFRRVSHGLYVPDVPATRGAARPLADLRALTLVLPRGAGFTHITSAWLRGWWLPRLPDLTPVFAAGPVGDRPRRAGLVYSRLDDLQELTVIQGLPVCSPRDTLARAARDLGLFDLTILLESALRADAIDDATLTELCDRSWPGVVRLRQARQWADPRSESPYETLLRFFHELAGIPVEPQFVITDWRGEFVARVDLLVTGTTSVHEYDGAVHGRQQQRVKDLRRDRRLADTPYSRRGFVADDLFGHPVATLREIDRVVGRPHRVSRLRPWRRHLAESSYSLAGRQRLLNRWLRLASPADWSRTA